MDSIENHNKNIEFIWLIIQFRFLLNKALVE